MRTMGINWLAVLAAAIAVYAVGFILYGLLIPPAVWMEAAGITQAEADAVGTSRMIYGPIMPLVIAAGTAVLFKWANVAGAAKGIAWGALVAAFSALPALWYGWVYGVGDGMAEVIDSAHLLLSHMVAGAIIAAWR